MSPTRIRHEPSAHFWTPSVKLTGRRSFGPRPSARTVGGRLPMVMTSSPQPWRHPTAHRARRSRGRAGRRPGPRRPRSTLANRRRNLAFAARMAASASTPAPAGDVDQHEQQVAELLGPLGVVGRAAQLVGLLDDLVEDAVDRRPVVAEVGGPLLHLLAGGEGRHRGADPVEGALRRGRALGRPSWPSSAEPPPSARSSALIRSHWRLTSDAVRAIGVAEDVRVAADDLGRDRGLDVGQVEDAGLGRQLGVEDDLEQQVAELPGELRRGARLERVVDLVGLLEQVLAQRGVGLLAIPRAAVGLAQPGARSRASPTGRRRPARARPARGRAAPSRSAAVERPRPSSPSARAEPPDRMVGRVEPRAGRRAGRRRPGRARPGQRRRRRRRRGGRRAERRRAARSGAGRDGSIGLPISRSAAIDLEPVGRVEPPAQPRLGDERVEHRPSR